MNNAKHLAAALGLRNLRLSSLVAITTLLVTALGLPTGVPMPLAFAQQATPQLSVQQRVLDNGMQVVWEVDSRQPLVAIVAIIKGGMRAEGPYLGTGITHFLEHMLFKGTETREPGTIDQEVRSYGGSINAFTSRDTTGVTLYVESQYLEQGLEMLADILQNAQFAQEEFDKELDVVFSEIQMNLDNPQRRLFPLFWDTHLQEHPYKQPILGHKSLLYGLSTQDLKAYYKAQYQPQNITLSCVGDIDPKSFTTSVDRIFGEWTRGRHDPLQVLIPKEPQTVSPRQKIIPMPIQTAYVMYGFPSVALSHPDLYALDVLSQILGSGASSRLHQRLVRKDQLVQSVAAWSDTPYDPGAFAVQFKGEPSNVDAALAVIVEEIETLKKEGVSQEELDKAKRQVMASYVFGLQTLEARAADLANSFALTKDPLFSRSYVEGIQQVQADQVKAAAIKYLDPQRATLAQILPETEVNADADSSVVNEGLVLSTTTLKNDMQALVGVDQSLPIATVVLALRGGQAHETEKTQGLSALAAQLLIKGTQDKNAEDIALLVESWGGSLDAFSGRDGFGLTLQVLSEDLDKGLDLLYEIATEYSVAAQELELQKQLTLQQLKALKDSINHVAMMRLRELHYGDHPYHFNTLGTEETVSSFSTEDVDHFLKKLIVPSNIVISVFGDVDQGDSVDKLNKTFGKIKKVAPVVSTNAEVKASNKLRTERITMDRAQSVVMLGFSGVTRLDEDRYVLDVMTAILSGMAGRLFQAIREEHGLAYTLGAFHSAGLSPGDIVVYAATKPEEKERVLELLKEQLNLLAEEGFTQEELDLAKRHLIGEHRMAIQGLAGVAQRSTIDQLYGVGYDEWKAYEERIQSVTTDQLLKAANEYLRLENHVEVIVAPEDSNG